MILPTVIRDNCPKASRLSYYKNPTSLKSGKTNDDTGFDLFLGLSRVSHMTLGKDREASKRYQFGLGGFMTHQKALIWKKTKIAHAAAKKAAG